MISPTFSTPSAAAQQRQLRRRRRTLQFTLKKKHFLDHDAQSLLASGESLFAKTKLELEALADELAPGKGVEAVARAIQENHPSSEQILSRLRPGHERGAGIRPRKEAGQLSRPRKSSTSSTRRCFAATRFPSPLIFRRRPKIPIRWAIIMSRQWRATIYCASTTTSVSKTPRSMRAIRGIICNFPSPIARPPPRLLPRLMNESSVFYEGWALYCEQLMQEQGFLK